MAKHPNTKTRSTRRSEKLEVRLLIDERKKLDLICEEAGTTISELVRFRVLNLSEGEIEAIRQGAFVTKRRTL
jgi:PHP family Zn ribbon phosphoesterase